MLGKLHRLSPRSRFWLAISVNIATVLLCCWLSFTRLPGMQVLGIGPDWLLIWLVSWSLNRSLLDSALAGIVLGAIQDGLTTDYPSHILVYGAIGLLTARLHQQRYIKEEPIAVVLIVFFMTLLAEGAIALQYYFQNVRSPSDLWLDYQRLALTSAVLSSLWSPVLYYPLREWWRVARE